MKRITIIIADGSEVYLEGMHCVLSELPYVDIYHTFSKGSTLLNRSNLPNPDLFVISTYFEDMPGIQLATSLKLRYPNSHILIMSNQVGELQLDQFLESGANGLMLKNTPKKEFIHAIKKVASGDRYLGKHFSKLITKEYIRLSKQRLPRERKLSITRREKEILGLLVNGLTSTEIAGQLFISPRTVDTHRTNLLHKLKLKNTAALVRFALENEQLIKA